MHKNMREAERALLKHTLRERSAAEAVDQAASDRRAAATAAQDRQAWDALPDAERQRIERAVAKRWPLLPTGGIVFMAHCYRAMRSGGPPS